MQIRQLQGEEHPAWDAWVRAHPAGSLWQSADWEGYQRALGRKTRVYGAFEGQELRAAALVVIDRTTGGLSTWNLPRGPVGAVSGERLAVSLLKHIVEDAKKERCLSVYFSPPQEFSIFNFQFSIRASARHEQPEATRILDLTIDDHKLLAQMKPKGRYNIRVAEKNGVRVEASDDVAAFHALMRKTSERDAFGILPERHYRTFLKSLPGAFLLMANEKTQKIQKTEGTQKNASSGSSASSESSGSSPIAGLLGVTWNGQGIYYYGASDYTQRALMAPYLLQWEAMQRCRKAGCGTYDLLGVAPEGAPENHPWAGVSRFKAQFGGSSIAYSPEQQIVLRPLLQRLLHLKRRWL